MAVWSIVKVSDLEGRRRLDPEYYRPEYLRPIRLLVKHPLLGQCVTKIIHPVEIKRVYEDRGLQILLAQNIQHNFLEFSAVVFMPESVLRLIRNNKLLPNDVVLTRSGANYGDAAPYFGEPDPLYACADDLVIRPKPDLPAGYLATFFNTDAGRALIKRGRYGTGQPHIAPPFLKTLRVPRFSPNVEQDVDSLARSARDQLNRAESLYVQAEQLLLDEIGFKDLDLRHQLCYTVPFKKTKGGSRLDAEYFQPKYERALALIGRDGKRIGNLARLRKARFKPRPGKTFDYIEISNVSANGRADGEKVMGEDAPSRATWVVHTNDVISSTVRPIRRLSALIQPEQHGYVSSSGFAVLEPIGVEPEVLLVFLRLSIVCEILDLKTKASMYPAISPNDLLDMPISLPSHETGKEIARLVKESLLARQKMGQRLEEAKKKVEDIIERGA